VQWEIVRDEGVSAGSLNRPALLSALQRLDQGDATMLLAYRLDRLSRSVSDFSGLLDRSRRKSWRLVVCDVDVDTGTPSGEFLVNVVAAAAQFERRLIGQRTREGMAQRRAEGVHLGRPPSVSSDVIDQIRRLRSAGASLRTVANQLNAEGVPTAHGGRAWYASTVSSVLNSVSAIPTRDNPRPAPSG
jgi:DNA invertase Pin-like site-specific DNA recombinase